MTGRTRPGAGGGPPGDGGRRLLVPLYVHPAVSPQAWTSLTGAAAGLYAVVLNVADGPGHLPDPDFRAAADELRGAGVRLLGYADTGYGHRPPREIIADIRKYRRWYDVDGIFFDQAAAQAALLPRYRRLVRLARALGARRAVLNPGTHPDPGYALIADLLVTFEGSWESYRRATVPNWTADHPPERFCHLVYGVPPGHAEQVARTADGRGAAVHCAVPGEGANPWQTAPLTGAGTGLAGDAR